MNQDYLLSNSTYDLLKRVVTIALPGLAVAYAALANVLDLPDSKAVIVTFAALALLGGLLMSVSTKSWDNSNGKYDGELFTVGNDSDTGLPNLQLNVTRYPSELVEKRTVLFKSIDLR